MILDTSYFVGPLTIAQLGQPAVEEDLNIFIDEVERKVLRAALGYDLYQAFLEGLDVGSGEEIEQKWLDLLNGVEFTNQSDRKKRWLGFTPGSDAYNLSVSNRNTLYITAGTTGFPVGGNSYTDASLDGWNYTLDFRGIGEMIEGTEWTKKDGGGIQLTDDDYEVQPGEIWIIRFKSRVSATSPVTASAYSPLAAFVWAEYMRQKHTQVTGVGIVKSEAENASAVNPSWKICEVFNEAVRHIKVLHEFLSKDNGTVYTDYDYSEIDYNYFKPVNAFGI